MNTSVNTNRKVFLSTTTIEKFWNLSEEAIFYELVSVNAEILGMYKPKEIPLTIIFSVAAIVVGIMRLILLWVSIKISNFIGINSLYEAPDNPVQNRLCYSVEIS